MKPLGKILLLISILACAIILSSCKNVKFGKYDPAKDSDNTKNTGSKAEVTLANDNSKEDNAALVNSINEDEDDKDDPTPTVIKPVENKELLIYTVNSEAVIEPVTALIPKDTVIDPRLIVDTVVENMADMSYNIGIDSVTTDKDIVIVSFLKDKPPLVDVGASYELAILDAIAQSLIDNLDDYSKVIYRVEGEAYISGHVQLGYDEVYMLD
jgi:hypothetical protein